MISRFTISSSCGWTGRLVAIAVLTSSTLDAQDPSAVRTVAPIAVSTSQSFDLPGRTEPYESATLFTRATGVVRERRFDIGDTVTAGEIVAVIETPEVDRAVDAARATVEQVKVRAANARATARRAQSLLGSQAISLEDAEDRTALAEEMEASLRVAEAELSRLEEQQKFATVRAPFDGVIAARNFDRGDRVRGDAATADGWLYRLVRLDLLRFTVAVTPDIGLRLANGGVAEVRFNEFPGRTFPATVARRSRVFDAASGTSRVELLLENATLALPAGLTGTVSFQVPATEGTYLVPTNSLLTRSGRTTLATVKNGRVAFHDVRVERNLGATVELARAEPSLAPDSQVIINPNALLRPGDPVTANPLPQPN